ncbi:hypothetical protein [Micromonospora sp. DPT]
MHDELAAAGIPSVWVRDHPEAEIDGVRLARVPRSLAGTVSRPAG